MRKVNLVLACILAAPLPAVTAASAAQAQTASAASVQLQNLIAESERKDRARNPLRTASTAGERPSAAFMDPFGEAYVEDLRTSRANELTALRAIDRASLSPVDQIAYDVFLYRVEQQVGLFDSGLFDVRRNAPLNASFSLHLDFPDYMSAGGRFETVDDYEYGLQLMDGFADYMNATVTRLRAGMADGYVQSRIIVENVLKQVNAMLALPVEDSPFYAPIKRFPEAVPEQERQRLETAYRAAIAEKVYPAYGAWSQFLDGTYLPAAVDGPGLWSLKDGDRLYAADLERHTTTTMSADEIHQLGLREVARIRQEMEEVKDAAGFAGDLPAFFEHIRTDPRFYYTQPQQLIDHMEGIAERVYLKIPELFEGRPKARFVVRPLPALGDQRGTGYYRSGPPDASGPGVLYFNMSMLNTRPIPTLETLTIHEGISGHHYQRSLTQENESLPPILRFGSSTAYSEGWALYSESLGKDLGMFTDPYQLFGRLDMEMLRAVRLVVDTGLHAKRWSRQQAIDYMLANTSMAKRDVEVEIDRYISNPGQATAYKIGELKIQELRRLAEQTQGDDFDIRRFHTQILGTGSIPLAVLEAKIRHWLGTGGSTAN